MHHVPVTTALRPVKRPLELQSHRQPTHSYSLIDLFVCHGFRLLLCPTAICPNLSRPRVSSPAPSFTSSLLGVKNVSRRLHSLREDAHAVASMVLRLARRILWSACRL